MTYDYLLDLALILLSTKLMGLVTKKFKMPQVVGALLAGLILGPACIGLIKETDFIKMTAELGVIVLMFCAGLEADVKELKKSGGASLVIALLGVIVPLAGGFAVAYIFNRPSLMGDADATNVLLQNIFIGVILTATSVSITVETLKEMGKLKTPSGNAILGAAIIDDILGIIALTVVISLADTSVNVAIVLLKIVGFFVFAAIAGVLFYFFYKYWAGKTKYGMHRYAIVAFVFCLLLSYSAEEFFGVADITGAFIAGLVISMTHKSEYLEAKFDVISYLYLSPIFFASIGLQVVIPNMNSTIIVFAVVLTLVAALTKVLGCGLGAKMCKYQNYQAMRIGVGMISRGEVALIVASKGAAVGLLGAAFLGPIVVVVVITTIITPILLKLVFKKGASISQDTVLVENFVKLDELRSGNEAEEKEQK